MSAEEHHEHDDEEDERQRVEDLDEPHHDIVDATAQIAGNRAIDDADHQRHHVARMPTISEI